MFKLNEKGYSFNIDNCDRIAVIMPATYMPESLQDKLDKMLSGAKVGNYYMPIAQKELSNNDVFKIKSLGFEMKQFMTLYANEFTDSKPITCNMGGQTVKLEQKNMAEIGRIKMKLLTNLQLPFMKNSYKAVDWGALLWIWDRGTVIAFRGKCDGGGSMPFPERPCPSYKIEGADNIFVAFTCVPRSEIMKKCCTGEDPDFSCGIILQDGEGNELPPSEAPLCQAGKLLDACTKKYFKEGDGALTKICRRFGLADNMNLNKQQMAKKVEVAKMCFRGELDDEYCAKFLNLFVPKRRDLLESDNQILALADKISSEGKRQCTSFSAKKGPSIGCREWCLANPGECDKAARAYCDNGQLYGDDEFCNCLLSPTGLDGNMPICTDMNCINGQSYVPHNQHKAREAGCKIVNCSVIFSLASQKGDTGLLNNDVVQQCANTRDTNENTIKNKLKAIETIVDEMDSEIEFCQETASRVKEVKSSIKSGEDYPHITEKYRQAQIDRIDDLLRKIKNLTESIKNARKGVSDKLSKFSQKAKKVKPENGTELAEDLTAYEPLAQQTKNNVLNKWGKKVEDHGVKAEEIMNDVIDKNLEGSMGSEDDDVFDDDDDGDDSGGKNGGSNGGDGEFSFDDDEDDDGSNGGDGEFSFDDDEDYDDDYGEDNDEFGDDEPVYDDPLAELSKGGGDGGKDDNGGSGGGNSGAIDIASIFKNPVVITVIVFIFFFIIIIILVAIVK